MSIADRMKRLAGHRHADKILGAVCFAEASIIPAFPEVMLAPMIMTDRRRAWYLAALCTLTSVVGGLVGYAIGMFLFEAIGEPILAFYGLGDDFEGLAQRFQDAGWLVVLIGAISPIPYKVVTITSGVVALDLWTFVLAGIVGRGIRYLLPCALLYLYGPTAIDIVTRHPKLSAWLAIAMVVFGTLGASFFF